MLLLFVVLFVDFECVLVDLVVVFGWDVGVVFFDVVFYFGE